MLVFAVTVAAQEPTLPSPDAKTLGMGGVEMTTLAGSHTIYNNMAMAAFSQNNVELSSSYLNREEYDFYTVTGSYRINYMNTVQTGWRRYRRSSEDVDMAFDLGYARRIGEGWSAAVTGRYLHLTRPDKSYGAVAFDLSVAHRAAFDGFGDYSEWRIGARVSDLGRYLDDDTPYTLPASAAVGGAVDGYFSDSHRVTLAADVRYSFTPDDMRGFGASIGAEYNLMQLFMFRAGYHLSDRGAGTSDYGSVGCGVRFMHLRLDFAYLFAGKSSPLRNEYSLSFGLDF